MTEEVKRILSACYRDAVQILEEHKSVLERVAARLLKVETLDRLAFEGLLQDGGSPPPE